jgi:hypothetical protein
MGGCYRSVFEWAALHFYIAARPKSNRSGVRQRL